MILNTFLLSAALYAAVLILLAGVLMRDKLAAFYIRFLASATRSRMARNDREVDSLIAARDASHDSFNSEIIRLQRRNISHRRFLQNLRERRK